MKQDHTQIWQQAMAIYADISNLSAQKALSHIDSIHDLSFELKQAVITLINAGSQASQYIEKNFTPDLQQFHNELPEYKLGTILGEYKLVEKLGQGGMSQVFKAKRLDSEPQKMVAIKIFSPRHNSPLLLDHFINEQKILSQFNHANIVDMLHGGKTDGTAYLVMELIAGAMPIDNFSKENNLSHKDKIKYIAQCADALSYSHANLIIHRDLKPDNILINKDKELKIVDFGIAKLINNNLNGQNTTIMALTPNYAAPEQINSENISVKTDVFSLAVVATELLVGKQFLPKDRLIKSCEKDGQTIDKTLKELNADKDLKNILHKALRQDPNERYASMQSFADDLNNYLNNEPVDATSQSLFYRIGKFAKRRTTVFVMSLTLFSALVLGLGITLWQNHKIKIESAKAQNVKEFMLNSFEVTDPNNSQGINISANDILKNAATKLNDNIELDREVKFELSQSLAIAYFQLGFLNESIDLFNKALLIKPNDSKSITYLANNYLLSEHQEKLNDLLSTTDETLFKSKLDEVKFSLIRAKNLSINGDSDKGVELINRIINKQVIKINPIEQINVQLALAKIYHENTDYKKEVELLNPILTESLLPQTHTLMLSVQLELGRTYNAMGEYDLSLAVLNQLETAYKQILGDNHPDLGRMYKTMSSNFKATGQIQKAHEYAQRSYEHNVKTFNNKGIAVSESLNMLAVLAFSINDNIEKAIELTKKALDVMQPTYPDNHPRILELNNNYAFLLSQNKQNKEALAILNQVHTAQKEKFGINHQATILTNGTIIGVLLKLKQLDKAKKMAIEHLDRVKNNVSNKNIRLVNAYSLMAKVYLHTKNKQKRLETLLEVYNQNLLSDSGPHLIFVLRDIALAYHLVGDDENAELFFQKSLNINNKIFADSHILTLKLKLHYAVFLKAIGDLDKVKQILIEVKESVKQEKYNDAWIDKRVLKLESVYKKQDNIN